MRFFLVFQQQLRVLTYFLILTFGLDSISLAHAQSVTASVNVAPSIGLGDYSSFPDNLGNIIQKNEISKNAFNLIHLQDAHANPEAQKKIAELIRYFSEEQGYNTVFVEGAYGRLDKRYIEFTDDFSLNQKIAERLTALGEFTAPDVYLSKNKKSTLQFLGIEDPQLYRKNVTHLKKIYQSREEIESWIEAKKLILDRKNSRLKNKNLFYLFKTFLELSEKTNNFSRHLVQLNTISKRELGRDLQDAKEQIEYPNIVRFLRLFKEQKLDREKARVEWEEIVKTISKQKQFLKRAPSFKELNDLNVRVLLETLVEEQGVDFKGFPIFSKYAKALIYQQEMDGAALFAELNTWLLSLINHFSLEAQSKNLFKEIQLFILIKKLLKLELKREEWGLIKDEEIKDKEVQNLIDEALLFYKAAEKREQPFLEQIQNQIKNKKIKKAILLTGGFHTPALLKHANEDGWNSVVIAPQLTSAVDQDDYFKNFMGRDPKDIDVSQVVTQPYSISPETAVALGVDLANRQQLVNTITREFVKASSLGERKEILPGFFEERPLFIPKDGRILRSNERLLLQAGDHYFYVDEKRVVQVDSTGKKIKQIKIANKPLKRWELSEGKKMVSRSHWASNEKEFIWLKHYFQWQRLAKKVYLNDPVLIGQGVTSKVYSMNVAMPQDGVVRTLIGTEFVKKKDKTIGRKRDYGLVGYEVQKGDFQDEPVPVGAVRKLIIKTSSFSTKRSIAYQELIRDRFASTFIAKTAELPSRHPVAHELGLEQFGRERILLQEPLIPLSQILREARGYERQYWANQFVRRVEDFWKRGYVDLDARTDNWGVNSEGKLVFHDFDFVMSLSEMDKGIKGKREDKLTVLSRKIQFFANFIINNVSFLYSLDPELAKHFYERVVHISFELENKQKLYLFNDILSNAAGTSKQLKNWEQHWKRIEVFAKQLIQAHEEQASKEKRKEIVKDVFNFLRASVKKRQALMTQVLRLVAPASQSELKGDQIRRQKGRIIKKWAEKYSEPFASRDHDFEKFIELTTKLVTEGFSGFVDGDRAAIRDIIDSRPVQYEGVREVVVGEIVRIMNGINSSTLNAFSRKQINNFFSFLVARDFFKRHFTAGESFDGVQEIYIGSKAPHFQFQIASNQLQPYHFVVLRVPFGDRGKHRVVIFDMSVLNGEKSQTQFRGISEQAYSSLLWQPFRVDGRVVEMSLNIDSSQQQTMELPEDEIGGTRLPYFSQTMIGRLVDWMGDIQAFEAQFADTQVVPHAPREVPVFTKPRHSRYRPRHHRMGSRSIRARKRRNIQLDRNDIETNVRPGNSANSRTYVDATQAPKTRAKSEVVKKRRRLGLGRRPVELPPLSPRTSFSPPIPTSVPNPLKRFKPMSLPQGGLTSFNRPPARQNPTPQGEGPNVADLRNQHKRMFGKRLSIWDHRMPPQQEKRRGLRGNSLGSIVSVANLVADKIVAPQDLENEVIVSAVLRQEVSLEQLFKLRELFDQVGGDGFYKKLFGANSNLSVVLMQSSQVTDALAAGIDWALVNQPNLILRIINDGTQNEQIEQLKRKVKDLNVNHKAERFKIVMSDLSVVDTINYILRDKGNLYKVAHTLDSGLARIDVTKRTVVLAKEQTLEDIDKGLSSKVIFIPSEVEGSALYQFGISTALAANEGRLTADLKEHLRISKSGHFVFQDFSRILHELMTAHQALKAILQAA